MYVGGGGASMRVRMERRSPATHHCDRLPPSGAHFCADAGAGRGPACHPNFRGMNFGGRSPSDLMGEVHHRAKSKQRDTSPKRRSEGAADDGYLTVCTTRAPHGRATPPQAGLCFSHGGARTGVCFCRKAHEACPSMGPGTQSNLMAGEGRGGACTTSSKGDTLAPPQQTHYTLKMWEELWNLCLKRWSV